MNLTTDGRIMANKKFIREPRIKKDFTLTLSIILLVLIFLPQTVKADFGDTKNIQDVSIITQNIFLSENKSAFIEFYMETENDTTTDHNYFSFWLLRENQNFTDFDCHGFTKNLRNGSISNFEWNMTNSNLRYLFDRQERTIWFNHTEASSIRLWCNYVISNYTEEIQVAEWLFYDEFPNKHSAKLFYIDLYIPKNTIFKEINPPTYIENCRPNDNCQQKLFFRWDKDSEYKPPRIYLRYEKISLNLNDIFRRHGTEFVLGGFIGGAIALLIERLVKVFGRKIYKDIKQIRRK